MSTRSEEISRRQVQWDAFARWELEHKQQLASLEQRIAWYIAAFKFSRNFIRERSSEELQAKVQFILAVRERLTYIR
jgi:hypothetical protein